MSIPLTREQEDAIDQTTETPPRFVAPRTHATYVLISADEYESVREILEDEREQRGIRKIALRNAGRRMDAEP